jgi:hypothetical protein
MTSLVDQLNYLNNFDAIAEGEWQRDENEKDRNPGKKKSSQSRDVFAARVRHLRHAMLKWNQRLVLMMLSATIYYLN